MKKNRRGLYDIFEDLGIDTQGIIDSAAEAAGIEKGGVIDKAVTTAADVGKKAGVIPGDTSGNGYIDNSTFDVIDKFTGGKKTGTGTQNTSTGTQNTGTGGQPTPGLQTKRTSSNTGVAQTGGSTTSSGGSTAYQPTTLAQPTNLLEKVNPWWTGTGVTLASYFITKRLGLSAGIGGAALLSQQAYRVNRM